MKKHLIIPVVLVTALLGACSGETAPEVKPTNSSSAPVASGNDLVSSEGLSIFGKPAADYQAQSSADVFTVGDLDAVVRAETIMEQPKDGKCFDAVVPYGSIDESTTMAVLTPAEIRCEYDGGEELPTSTRTGLVVQCDFEPFDSTEGLVPGDSPRQTYDMASDDKNVYWLETASTSLSHDEWRLFSADIETGSSRLLLTAEEGLGLQGPLPVTAKTNLTYRDGRLYFLGYFPTEQYFAKADRGEVDAEGWEEGDFVQGVLSVKTDGTDLTIAGESIFDFGFNKEHITYIKFGPSTLSFLTPEGGREQTQADVPGYIAMSAGETESVLVEDTGFSDGSFHSEMTIANFRADEDSIVFTRGVTAYVLDVLTGDAAIVDVAQILERSATGKPLAEAPAEVTDVIHVQDRLVLIVKSESEDDIEHFIVDYDVQAEQGKIYPSSGTPYALREEHGDVTFRLDTGEIAAYVIPR